VRRLGSCSANFGINRRAGRAYRFIDPRYENDLDAEEEPEEVVQYQLFSTKQFKYRVFVTNMTEPIDEVVWFYNQGAEAENLIKESTNDAGMAAHPSRLFGTSAGVDSFIAGMLVS
jgi:hypothetical protein